MTSKWSDFATRHSSPKVLVTLVVLAIATLFFLPRYNVVDYDVAFLTWTAGRLLGGAVYGHDVLDVNLPLAPLIYMPAALVSPLVGFDWGVRLWMLFITLLSLLCVWNITDKALRLPTTVVLFLFVTFAFPNHFGQREQIALLLCAPYVAAPAKGRGWALLSGLMAGIGFSLKPFFLIPFLAIMFVRRRVGTEERMILVVGAAYAFILLVFFKVYLLEMIPLAWATYWAISFPLAAKIGQPLFIVLASVPMSLAAAPQPQARSYLAATLGFTASAVLQNKGFVYHFIPAYGFLALYLTVMSFNARKAVALFMAVFLLLEAYMIMSSAQYWRGLQDEQRQVDAELREVIDKSESYTSFVPEPYPGFPLAIRTPARYVGIASIPLAITAVAKYELGFAEGDATLAKTFAVEQALRELANKPEVVITLNGSLNVDGRPFSMLDWLSKDARFREAWASYAPERTIGPFRIYRRTRENGLP